MKNEARVRLRKRITCPHCWHEFPPAETRWVAEHPSLLGDTRLGDSEHLRFLPSRFDVKGNAIDSGGAVCQEIACPNCHLSIPRAMLETGPVFVSIVGAPACGKTYFLASMIQKLRETLPRKFRLSITDSDPKSNKILNDYVEQQFFNQVRDKIVRLAKTEEQGDLYSTVMINNRAVTLPMPFLFTVAPHQGHPFIGRRNQAARVLCVYDNAGESFLPGKDTGQNLVTRHLARSNAILFLFDPTQDVRFRAACQDSKDPQIEKELVTSRQETLLHELAQRVRRHVGLGQNEQCEVPLIIVLTKHDAWESLSGLGNLQMPVRPSTQSDWNALDNQAIQKVSDSLRELMWRFSPELVTSAEAFSKKVLYVPVSSFGASAETDPESGEVGISPGKITPQWCDLPLLWVLSQRCEGLVPYTVSQESRETKLCPKN